MRRTFRTTLAVLATAAAVSGCSSDPNEAVLDEAAAAAQSVQAFCDAARANVEAAKPVAALNSKGPAPHPAEEITAAVEPLRESNQAMLDTAPDQVRPDAQMAYDLAEMQLGLYESSGGDPAAVTADPAYVAKAQESDAALQRMQSFLRTACGVDAG